MRAIDCLRPALVISALALLLFAGCFETADPSELSCTQSKYCPDGYVCVGAQAGSPGKCQKPADAGQSDGIIVADSADSRPNTDVINSGDGTDGSTTSTDGQANTETWTDSPVRPNDGPATNPDTPATIDQAPWPDIPNQMDTASDLLASADLGRDLPSDAPISPLDTSPDNPPSAADLGPDQKSEAADVAPDLSYGPEVGPDLPPTSCLIGGTTYASGAANPANTCQICKPVTSASGWSNADEGTSCDGGQYCNSGVCKAGCFIAGTYYANGAANPANPCQTCQTAYALTSWTAGTNGTSCGTGQVCSSGTCQSGCWIGSALVGSGTTNSSNVCQICKPAASTSAWSKNVDGTDCGGGRTCAAGACGCPAPTTDCGSSGCIDVGGNDSNHCGSCTKVCASNQTCSSGTCACTKGAPACGGCLAWDFESGTAEGWSKDTNPLMPVNGGARNGVTNVLVSQTHHDGSYALAFPALIDLTNTFNASVTVPICPGSTINLSGYTMSAWIYVTGTDLGSDTFLFFDAWGPSGMISNPALTGQKLNTLNTWQQATTAFSSPVDADHVSIRLNDPPSWTGTIYVDSVTITPP